MFSSNLQLVEQHQTGANQTAAFGTLDDFGREPGCEHGVCLNSLRAGTAILVRTRHSDYRFVVIDGPRHRATVIGGSTFPECTEIRINGATAGGSVIKSGWIGVGLRIELTQGSRRITTSRVQSVAVEEILFIAPAA